MTFPEYCALAIALAACVWDLRTGRIPNHITLTGAVAGILFSTVIGGVQGLGASLLGWVIAAALWLPIYALGGIGAGDVKLVAALGAWLGPGAIVRTAIYAAVAGALIAVVVAARSGRLAQTFSNIRLLLTHWRVAGFTPHSKLTLAASASPRLAYAVPILAGTMGAIWLG